MSHIDQRPYLVNDIAFGLLFASIPVVALAQVDLSALSSIDKLLAVLMLASVSFMSASFLIGAATASKIVRWSLYAAALASAVSALMFALPIPEGSLLEALLKL